MMHGASEVWAGECGRRFGVEGVEIWIGGKEGRKDGVDTLAACRAEEKTGSDDRIGT